MTHDTKSPSAIARIGPFAMKRAAALAVALLAGALVTGCQATPAKQKAEAAPSLEDLRNATYWGLDLDEPQVTLQNGRWEGKPFVEGGAARPSVHLVRDFRLVGNLNDSPDQEAATLLAESSGGSGEYLYLAVMDHDGAIVRNLDTAPVGDRVQVRDAKIENHEIVLDVVQAGPEDAACCPGALVRRTWRMNAGRLEEQPAKDQGRLSLDAIEGQEWVLRAWDVGIAAPESVQVTLTCANGHFAGKAGCNRYSATAKDGEMPGDISVGPAVATKMMCPPPVMKVEDRFLSHLHDVKKYGFMTGQLMLSYETDSGWRTMLFSRHNASEPPPS